MDISGTEQLSICLRYVDFPRDPSCPILREDFAGFVPIDNQSFDNLTDVLLQPCNELKLNMNKCIGQGYEEAANMAGHWSGAKGELKTNMTK